MDEEEVWKVGTMQRLLRRAQEEDGFTLIELMVVVMILAILIVMGLPTFLGVKSRFQDRGAQTDLRNAVLSARILYTDTATFESANAAELVQIVPNMCYVDGTASAAGGTVACDAGVGSGSISVLPSGSPYQQFAAARLSSSQSCFVILDGTSGTLYGKTTLANCNATWVNANAGTLATNPAAADW
jgi:type IV pilus assembly protein PilA